VASSKSPGGPTGVQITSDSSTTGASANPTAGSATIATAPAPTAWTVISNWRRRVIESPLK
jgi:hypothetical protein